MIEASRTLAAIGQLSDGEIDLADAALQLGRALRPTLDAAPAANHLSELAREAAAIGELMSARPLEARVGALAGRIDARHGYRGDRETYDDLANANLLTVHERRLGLPVSLGIIWIHCIRSAGWQGRGIDFPGHFLIQMDATLPAATKRGGKREQQVLIDVFAAGETVGMGDLVMLMRRHLGPDTELQPGMLRPMSNRDVLLRLQRNTSERRRAAGENEAALACLETMLAIAPDHASLWREAGSLNATLSRFRAAIECFERFVALVPDGEDSRQARARISSIRAKLS